MAMTLQTVASGIEQLLNQVRCLVQTEQVSLQQASGRVLAQDVISAIDVPPANNSAMDGYALCAADLRNDQLTALPISQRIQAGDAPMALTPGTAARIFTGAEIPAGADTVVMQENCRQDDDQLIVLQSPRQGENIRPQGQDIRRDSTILLKGTRLRPQEVSLLASIGIASIEVYQPLTVAIINTGNELVEPGKPLKPGQIYNSNRFLLDGMLQQWGFKTIHQDIVNDTLADTQTALSQAAEQADIVISTGGVSVGEEDHIKPAVEALGKLELWKMAIKPGKPFAFGHIEQTPFIGLPGNPASGFVTLLIIARPFLLASQGRKTSDLYPAEIEIKANFSRKTVKREEYLRARLSQDGVEPYSNQSSGVLVSSCWGDCLVKQAIGDDIKQGQLVKTLFYQNLFF